MREEKEGNAEVGCEDEEEDIGQSLLRRLQPSAAKDMRCRISAEITQQVSLSLGGWVWDTKGESHLSQTLGKPRGAFPPSCNLGNRRERGDAEDSVTGDQ